MLIGVLVSAALLAGAVAVGVDAGEGDGPGVRALSADGGEGYFVPLDPRARTRTPPTMADLDTARARLEGAAEGLPYLSENEAPFEFVSFGAAPDPLTPESFRALAGAPADAPVQEVTLERFLAGHIERADPEDPGMQALVPRYRALREALASNLQDVRVFRVGRVEIRVYAVGRTAGGELAGLVTTAYET